MMKMKTLVIAALALFVLFGAAPPAFAQLGRIVGGLQKAKKAADTIDNLTFTDAEEQELGTKVSTMLRQKYGVAQDKAAHKYLSLVGTVLAQASSRPKLTWTFIILDTDGVNAFASPGGFIHVTRGALALIRNEAELAGVLGHEIAHVTEKHTLNAIKKGNAAKELTSLAGPALLEAVANKAYEAVLENAYDRGDEKASDSVGFTLATGAGYAPNGLSAFLSSLAERNKTLKERSGVFASHPETKDRLDALARLAAVTKTTATVAARYQQNVPFKPVPVEQVAGGASAAASTAPAKASGGGFGLSGLNPLGREKASDQTVASAGSRGVNPDRDAKGGSNSMLVPVTLTAAEIADFRKGIV